MIKDIHKKKIFDDLIFFLESVQEDTPIPRETKNVYFTLNFSNNDIEFSYSADERKLKKENFGFYFPLDAQYFHSQELKKLSISLFDENKISKQEIVKMFENFAKNIKKHCFFLKNCEIFLKIKE